MKRVAVIGAGQSVYGTFPEKTLKELCASAAADAYASVDKGFNPKQVEEAFVATLGTGGSQLGNFAALMAESAGMIGIPASHVENACASSGFAFRHAVMAVASGQVRVAAAAGIEKMSDLPRERNRLWLGISGDVEWERLAGTNFPGIYAMMARRHMYEHKLRKEDLTAVAMKNRANAVHNPKAQFRTPLDRDKALKAPNLAAPFNVSDACGITDGASMVIVCDLDIARDFTDRAVEVTGWGAATDYVAIHDRPTMTQLAAARKAAREAYAMSKIGPDDISLAEVHDCFTIGEILAYADLGFCEPHEAGRWASDGVTQIAGRKPVNASGGLIGKGHPIGATGTGQIYELFHQLRGAARDPARQVRDPRYGIAHNVGGSGGSVAVHILKAAQ